MKVCETCGGLRATSSAEMIAGTPCRCYIEVPAFGGRENAWEEQTQAILERGGHWWKQEFKLVGEPSAVLVRSDGSEVELKPSENREVAVEIENRFGRVRLEVDPEMPDGVFAAFVE